MKRLITGLAIVALTATFALAQSKVMPLETGKTVLNATKGSFIAFRNYNGTQLIYFTHLVSHRCQLKEVRYSINSNDLDRKFPLSPCNPDNPFAIGPNDQVYLNLPPGTAKSVTVQVIFKDESSMPVLTYVPCNNAGESTCGKLQQ